MKEKNEIFEITIQKRKNQKIFNLKTKRDILKKLIQNMLLRLRENSKNTEKTMQEISTINQ